ncbi:DUF3079 domain-containing protein [Vogesella alkaliphila]|uniref:DUF3079 domain-containing protein n=1 Tax=Vogesella alkaliphila TaxID=1193621 RepID=A0ABQ2Y9S5_9NEIS|nr:hypothetical protein GCM10011290_00910 [Vogesella alkaliphila]
MLTRRHLSDAGPGRLPGTTRDHAMAKKFPLHPRHPERICWGCDKYCPAGSLQCGNGSGRTQHPAEMLGDDWYLWGDWGITPDDEAAAPAIPSADSDN